jgi:uncharacterized protein (TIGR03118 family)
MDVRATLTACGATLLGSLVGAAGVWAAIIVPASADTLFQQQNLVSDGAVPAMIKDPNLVNPWGIGEGPGFPFWVSDNGTGVATIYSVSNSNIVSKVGLTVTVPPASGAGTSAPTGQVFNTLAASGAFRLSNGSPALFLFDSEDGAISGWNPTLPPGPPPAATAVFGRPPTPNAVYKGLAISDFKSDTINSGTLYATNFRSGMVEMYDSSFNLVASFTDPTLPAGYAPFGTRVLDGKLYVTFALQDGAKHDDVAGAGHGFVDTFDLSGGSMTRLISQGALNSPWGLEIAPSTFGKFANDLLVGNFGDGMINAFDTTTGVFEGTLDGPNGLPLSITDLWAITLGNGSGAGSPNSLYFTAGLVDEGDGLFGSLTVVPEPSTWALMLVGFAGLGFVGYRKAKRLTWHLAT